MSSHSMATSSPASPAIEPYTFEHLTEPATSVDAVRRTQRMPALVEPDLMPLALDDCGEPLVLVADVPGVVDLAAYRSVNIPGSVPASLLREGAAGRLARVSQMLPAGYGLAVFDAWRPLAVQQHLFDVAYADPALPPGFVTPPSSNPDTPPPHLTGGTVDLTLTHHGRPLGLGTSFDDFTDAAHAAAFDSTLHPARDLRRLLFWTMRAAGFAVIDCEWWHFEYGTRRWAAIRGGHPVYRAAEPPDNVSR